MLRAHKLLYQWCSAQMSASRQAGKHEKFKGSLQAASYSSLVESRSYFSAGRSNLREERVLCGPSRASATGTRSGNVYPDCVESSTSAVSGMLQTKKTCMIDTR